MCFSDSTPIVTQLMTALNTKERLCSSAEISRLHCPSKELSRVQVCTIWVLEEIGQPWSLVFPCSRRGGREWGELILASPMLSEAPSPT